MESPHGITAPAFRLKCFKLLFLLALSAIILAGCERQLVSPVAPTDPSPNTRYAAQMALSDLADTADEIGFGEFAYAASRVAKILAIEDGTSMEPTYLRIVGLARAATAFTHIFVKAGCEVEELQEFREASVNVAKAYTIRDAADMEQALQKLAQAAVTAEKLFHELLLTNDTFIPFAFGYDYTPYRANNNYVSGEILVAYDNTIRPETETRTAVIEFLTLKGYTVRVETGSWFDSIVLDVAVDPRFLGEGLIEKIPGIASVQPNFLYAPAVDDEPLPPPLPPYAVMAGRIIHQVRTRYNEAWCQGNFDVIDSILIEESGLDFFDYAFIRNLADIYAEEIPEAAERIQANRFSADLIAVDFLYIYFQDSEKTLDEIIERFRQSLRNRQLSR